MGVSYIPGPPQYGQGGGGTDPQGIVQLAMAVKSFKMQEAQQKRANAQQSANLLMSNPALLVMSDPKDIEKMLKEGYDLKFTDQQPVDPKQATQVPTSPQTPPTADQPAGGRANATNIAQLSSATGGPAAPGPPTRSRSSPTTANPTSS